MPIRRTKPVPPALKINVWTGRPVGEPAPVIDPERAAALAAGQAALATARVPAQRAVGFGPGGVRPSEGLLAHWEKRA